MMKNVLKTEGVTGLYKGYTASYYSSILYGYLYFYLYKGVKGHLKESDTYRNSSHSTGLRALIYASSSTIAEIISLFIYYPWELVKIRLLTKNDLYKYESVSDAFVKILRKDGATGLYRGVYYFFLAFMGQYTL
jgi:Mitochondrial carrier protein